LKNKEQGYSKTRLRSSYLTLVISVSLVLFLLGVLGLVLINAKELSDYLRESLSFSIILAEEAKEPDIRMLQKDLDAKAYVKSTEYISKDAAAVKMKKELGEDFVSFLGDNPLPPTIDVYLHAGFTSPDSVAKIEKYVREYPFVKEVYVQESLLFLINENVKKISLFLLVISTFLFLIALTIINNTIRIIDLFQKVPDQDYAACWCNPRVHPAAIHCSERNSGTSGGPDCNVPFNGVALSYRKGILPDVQF
jgi:cell division transport system permease protein